MADRHLVPSCGVWHGKVVVKGIIFEGGFEVFGSNKSWAVLVGKPFLETIKAVHEYGRDTISIPTEIYGHAPAH